jgi:hypothetical protein
MGRRYRFGCGTCSYCNLEVAATKDGRAIRHGFIRVKKGYRRRAFPELRGGTTGYACRGSGCFLQYRTWFKPGELA